ncbi:hypothetical protein GCM10023085_73990 [Actinomadura viridis]|uniref:Uncharacterized protein n=1 Tax=Actinomadura viridis TaxID=58110 RepID=A0A931DEU8_9ACTN|nr:hypothetical protein [Actinomadura viridis]MBG6087519.1 hypothetical protein [Actinomadura viridis]
MHAAAPPTTAAPATTTPAPHATTARPVPRWVVWTAHAVPLSVLPAGLWRIAMGLGVPLGFSGEMARLYEGPDWVLTPYVILLSLITEGFALLTLGLVRPWGEVFPRWIPFLGGRPVPVMAAVTAASLGAVAVMWICGAVALSWNGSLGMTDPEAPQGAAAWLMILCYVPALAWGPLLAVVTAAYYVRRRGLTPSPKAGRDRI